MQAQGFLESATGVHGNFEKSYLGITIDTGRVATQVEQAGLDDDLLSEDKLNQMIQAVAGHLNERVDACNLPGDLNCNNITRAILDEMQHHDGPIGYHSAVRFKSDVSILIEQWERKDSRLGKKHVIGGIVFRRPEFDEIQRVLREFNPRGKELKRKLILQTIVLLKDAHPGSFISDEEQRDAIYLPLINRNCEEYNSTGQVKGFLREISGNPGYRTGDMSKDVARAAGKAVASAAGAVGSTASKAASKATRFATGYRPGNLTRAAFSSIGQQITGDSSYRYNLGDGSRFLGKQVSGMFGPSGGAAGPSGGAAGPVEGTPPGPVIPEGVPGPQTPAQPAPQPPAKAPTQSTPRWAQPDQPTTAPTAAPTDPRVARWMGSEPDDVAPRGRRAPQPEPQSVSQLTEEEREEEARTEEARLNRVQEQIRDLQAQAQAMNQQLKDQGGSGVRRTTRRTTRRTKRRKTKRYRKNTRRRTYKKKSRKKRRTRRR